MSAKYLILGALMENPDYGYNLKHRFFSRLLTDFGLNDGQLYPTLNRLERDEFILKSVETREGSPNRHKYTLTESGREEFLEWLESSDGEEKAFRYEVLRRDPFINRCIYLHHLPTERASRKIHEHIESVEKTLMDLKDAKKDMEEKRISLMKIKILEYGIKNQEARLEWLREFLDVVEMESRDR